MLDECEYLTEKLDILCDGTEINYLDYVVIRKDTLQFYLDVLDELNALYATGVDSWDGYDIAMKTFKE